MGWRCNSLVITLDEQKWSDSDKQELLSYIENEYENNLENVILDKVSLCIDGLYYDPDCLVEEITRKYPNGWFNAEVEAQSENSGEYQDINYSYDGNLKITKSDCYTEIDKAKKDGRYADYLSIDIKWKTEEKQISEVDSLKSKILDILYGRLIDSTMSKDAWYKIHCADNLNKKNSERYLCYDYPITDNNLFDFRDENEMLEMFDGIKCDGFEIRISYYFIDTGDDRQYDLEYEKKGEKAAKVSKDDNGYEYLEDY